jgi:DNA-binding CsgD family transcriptional regulator/PAS domain-containing protein
MPLRIRPSRGAADRSMADVISPQALSKLIGSIYDRALDPSGWDQTLSDVANAFDSNHLNLSLIDLRRDRFLLLKNVGLNHREIKRLPKYLPEINAILGGALADWPSLEEPHVDSRHLTPAYIKTSPLFQEWVRPSGTSDVMQFFLLHTPSHLSLLSVGRHKQQGLITARDIDLGKLLLPHLRRALTISKAVDVRTIAGARMAEALDALRYAVVLTNEGGTILHANRAAEHMLRDGGPIQSAQGTLQATAPSAASELRSALAFAARNETRIGKTGLAIRLTGPDVPPLFAHVMPLAGSDLRTRLQPAAVAAVFIGAPPGAQDGAESAAAAFGLTRAETRVLASLFAGRTLAETAANLRIAGTTAKTHLGHIFLKTGATRQVDLMRLWTGLASPT